MSRVLLPAALALLTLAIQPALAETTVIHTVEGRFGVSYSSDPNTPRGGLQPLYEGSYTASFLHQADNGLRFRFDIGVVVGNIQSDRPGHRYRGSSTDLTARN